jgi:hypothetical protein
VSFRYACFRVITFLYWGAWLMCDGLASLKSIHIPYPLMTDMDKGTYWLIYVTDW